MERSCHKLACVTTVHNPSQTLQLAQFRACSHESVLKPDVELFLRLRGFRGNLSRRRIFNEDQIWFRVTTVGVFRDLLFKEFAEPGRVFELSQYQRSSRFALAIHGNRNRNLLTE